MNDITISDYEEIIKAGEYIQQDVMEQATS